MTNDDNKQSGTDLPRLAPLSHAESSRRLRDMLGTIDPAELGEYQLVRRSDISLAAQMLTWGSEEGLTADQEREIRAQSEKLVAIAEANAPATFFNGGDSEREFVAAGADEDIHPLRGPRPSDWALARVFWNCMAYVPGVVPQTLSTEFLLRDARKLDAERPPLPKLRQSLKEYLAGESNLPSPSAAAIVVAFYEASRAFPLATALYWSHWVVERARQLDAEWAADPLKRLPLTGQPTVERAGFVAVPRAVLESIRDSSACTSARGFAAGALAEHDERMQFQAPAARGDATSQEVDTQIEGAIDQTSADETPHPTHFALVAIPSDTEAVLTCLDDDASDMLDADNGDERAYNMIRASEILSTLIAPENCAPLIHVSGGPAGTLSPVPGIEINQRIEDMLSLPRGYGMMRKRAMEAVLANCNVQWPVLLSEVGTAGTEINNGDKSRLAHGMLNEKLRQASDTADGAQRAAAVWLFDVDDAMVKRFCDGADDAFGWSPTGRELVRKGLEAALRPIAAHREDIHPDVYEAAWAAFQAAPTDALRAAVGAALKTAFPRKPLSGGDGDG